MAEKPVLTVGITIFSLISVASSLSSQTVLDAADTLSNSGFLAMSLTLELISQALVSNSTITTTTIFSPPDSAFAVSGQPSLSLVQLHLSPLIFSAESLRSLPYGTSIPTLSPGKSLIISTLPSDDQISLNNVRISSSPIFDDGSLIVFGIENFFNPNFTVFPPVHIPLPNIGCTVPENYLRTSFTEASGMLRSRGYSVMASFLDIQLLGFLNQPMKLTVFAPVDEVMIEHSNNIPEYSSLFLRHALPCKLAWSELIEFKNGTKLGTYLEGFSLDITESGDILMAANVPISFPDMYYSDWLVVHGIREIFPLPEMTEKEAESSEVDPDEESDEADRGEF